jgi:cytochrome c oxidase subunit III
MKITSPKITSPFEQRGDNKIHPQKFALWMGLGSIVMLFVALTSAYIVRKAQGNWLEFRLPVIFYYSTAMIFASSIALQAAYKSFLTQKEYWYKWLLVTALGLGIGFLVLQYMGWKALNAQEIYMDTNPSASFVFALTMLHAAHILGGIAVLLAAVISAFARPYKVTPLRKFRFSLVLTYWHFVDILWIYLLLFFITQ